MKTVFNNEEHLNAFIHGLGFLLSLIGISILLPMKPSISIGIYSVALVSVYAASTLSHAITDPFWRYFFRMLDQICIFLLIAGTFTPFAAVYSPNWLWVMWSLAFFGILFKIFFSQKTSISSFFYVAFAWIPIMNFNTLITMPSWLLFWVLLGGILYTAGTIFLANDHLPYFHTTWHLFVIAGSICHYTAMFGCPS